jgi:hypothetical protein
MKPRICSAALAVALILPPCLAAPAAAQDAPPTNPLAAQSKIKIEYRAPTDLQYRPIFDRLRQRQVLERLQSFLAPLRLPSDLTVLTAQCGGELSLPYKRGAPVTICYEYVALIEKVAPPEQPPSASIKPLGGALVTRNIALVGPFVQVVLHDVSRTAIDMLGIPVWGNVEDAADYLAAFLMLQFGADVAEKTIFGTAYFFSQIDTPNVDFAAIRPHVQQRYYNLLCIAVGSNLVRYSMFLPVFRQEARGDLPAGRMGSCLQLGSPEHSEYNKVRYAFGTLILKDYVDPDLLKQVRATDWLKDD